MTETRPEKFAHIVFRTNRFRETVEWYRRVLHAWPAFESVSSRSSPTTTSTIASRS